MLVGYAYFGNEITQISLQNTFLKGLMLAGIGTLMFSLGSSISKRNHNNGLEIIPSMAMGMVYGTLAMLIYALTQSSSFVLPESPVYWASLLYLVVPGSIVAFLCYLKLIKDIGPELAGYTTVLFPIVALVVSWALEGYNWSITHLLGLVLVIFGNVLVMRKKPLKEVSILKRMASQKPMTTVE